MEDQERVSEKNKAKNDQLNTFAHELRTPLTSILGFSEIILLEPDLEPGRRREYHAILRREQKRLSELIDTAIGQARIGQDDSIQRYRDHNILQIVSEALRALQHRIAEKALSVNVELPQETVPVPCDPPQILEAVSRLLLYAISSAQREGTIRVTLRVTSALVELRIGHDGPSSSDIPGLFQSREIHSIETSPVATDPDLTGIREIIDRHGGIVSVQSNEQEGLSLIITLPLRP